MEVYDSEYSLVGDVGQGRARASLVTLDIYSSAINEWENSGHHGARDLLSVFGSAPLTTLRFTADCGVVAAETWIEIFDRYPLLETLSLGILDTTETAFTGLMNAPPTTDSPVPCPGLRSISVTGRFDEGSLDATLRCLRDRAEKGHRLETIMMGLWGSQGDNLSFETHYSPLLKELVAEASCVFSCSELDFCSLRLSPWSTTNLLIHPRLTKSQTSPSEGCLGTWQDIVITI